MNRCDSEMSAYMNDEKFKCISNQNFTLNNWISTTYTSFKYLQFDKCKFTENFFDTYNNKNIEVLCFKECEFLGHNNFKNLPNLQKLIIKSRCKFDTPLILSDEFGLTQLKIFDTEIPSLSITSNFLTHISLYNIHCSNINFDSPNTEDLQLEFLPITTFTNFPKLEKLFFNNYDFSSFELPKSLKQLSISNSKTPLKSLDFLTSCINLEILDIMFCEILSLKGIENCKINDLYLYNCKLKNLDELLSIKEHLCSIDINWNQFENIDILNEFKKLTSISAGMNDITSVRLESSLLKNLNLRENKIREITLNCESLKMLEISDNELTNLEFVSGVPQLEILLIEHNQIEDLSPLIQLDYIEEISCRDNNFNYEDIPYEIIEITDMFRDEEDEEDEEDEDDGEVYNDKQNVHNSFVSRSISESIRNIMEENMGDITSV